MKNWVNYLMALGILVYAMPGSVFAAQDGQIPTADIMVPLAWDYEKPADKMIKPLYFFLYIGPKSRGDITRPMVHTSPYPYKDIRQIPIDVGTFKLPFNYKVPQCMSIVTVGMDMDVDKLETIWSDFSNEVCHPPAVHGIKVRILGDSQ